MRNIKDNLISVLVGVALSIPICIGARIEQTDRKEPKVDYHELTEVKPVALPIEEVEVTKVAEATPEPTPTKTYDSIDLIALSAEAEAGNQDLEGKRLVVDVILNRVDDPDFPNTVREVITQRNQFETWSNGSINRVKPSESTIEAVNLELASRLNYEILYFTAGGYGKYGTHWRKVGDHYFCTK